MFRNVLCCIVILLCMILEIKGMEEIGDSVKPEGGHVSLTPIDSDFQSFIVNKSDLAHTDWYSAIDSIESNVNFITTNPTGDNLVHAFGAAVAFCCPAVLNSFLRFSESGLFDLKSFDYIIAFMKLFPKIFDPEQVAINLRTSSLAFHDPEVFVEECADISSVLYKIVNAPYYGRRPFLTTQELKDLSRISKIFLGG